MKMNSMKKLLSLILCFVLIAAMALSMTGCASEETSEEPQAPAETQEAPAAEEETAEEEPAEEEEEPAKTEFTFVVVDASGAETTFDLATDKQTVGEALLEEGLIEGEDSEYGLYVKTVNGVTADYDVDGTYWAFYIDGEYALTGVDVTDVTAGSTYTFKVEGGEEAGTEENVLGEGAVSFTCIVVDPDGVETAFTVNTDETTVGAALLAVGLIEGDEGEYGLYVTTVNGVTLDWEKDQMYWAFYIDGEYAMTGVDATEITAGAVYTLKAEA